MVGVTGIFDLSRLISNQGFDWIVESIFTYLDPNSLAKCRLVSKSWKAFIDSRRTILVCQLQQLKQIKLEVPNAKVWYKLRRIVESQRKYSIIEKFPEFGQVFLDLERYATGHELSVIVMFLKDYSKHQRFPIGKLFNFKLDLKHFLLSKRIVRSPLHQAIRNGDQEFVRIIMKRTKLDFQSPIQVDGQQCVTYLALAVLNQAMVELLFEYALEKHINLNVPDERGQTAFHFACMHGTTNVVKFFLENVLEEFLQVNLLDQDWIIGPLHFACIGNQSETVQLLLDKSDQFGIDINTVDRNGWTLLHLAAHLGHEKVVKVLLEGSIQHDINVNALDFSYKTPFTIACKYGKLTVAKLLIEESRTYGIDLNCLDFGKSAMHYAIDNLHLDIARVMIDESKDKNIALNQENDPFRTDLLALDAWINSVGGLVYGRRPELWKFHNPLSITYPFVNQLRNLQLINAMVCNNWKMIFFLWILVFLTLSLPICHFQENWLPCFMVYIFYKFVSNLFQAIPIAMYLITLSPLLEWDHQWYPTAVRIDMFNKVDLNGYVGFFLFYVMGSVPISILKHLLLNW